MPETKYKLVAFRVEKPHLDRIDRLARKLKVTRSELIRLSVDEALVKLEIGYKGELQIINTKFLNTVLTNLGARIHELENPKGTVGDRVRKAGTTFAWLEDKKKQ